MLTGNIAFPLIFRCMFDAMRLLGLERRWGLPISTVARDPRAFYQMLFPHRYLLFLSILWSVLYVLNFVLILGLEWNNPSTLGPLDSGQKVAGPQQEYFFFVFFFYMFFCVCVCVIFFSTSCYFHCGHNSHCWFECAGCLKCEGSWFSVWSSGFHYFVQSKRNCDESISSKSGKNCNRVHTRAVDQCCCRKEANFFFFFNHMNDAFSSQASHFAGFSLCSLSKAIHGFNPPFQRFLNVRLRLELWGWVWVLARRTHHSVGHTRFPLNLWLWCWWFLAVTDHCLNQSIAPSKWSRFLSVMWLPWCPCQVKNRLWPEQSSKQCGSECPIIWKRNEMFSFPFVMDFCSFVHLLEVFDDGLCNQES